MNKSVLLTYGYEPPTQEIMDAWNYWFASIETGWLITATHLDLEEKSHIPEPVNCRMTGRLKPTTRDKGKELHIGVNLGSKAAQIYPNKFLSRIHVKQETLETNKKVVGILPLQAQIRPRSQSYCDPTARGWHIGVA